MNLFNHFLEYTISELSFASVRQVFGPNHCYENTFHLSVYFQANQLMFIRKVGKEDPFWDGQKRQLGIDLFNGKNWSFESRCISLHELHSLFLLKCPLNFNFRKWDVWRERPYPWRAAFTCGLQVCMHGWNARYVGETVRHFSKRVKEHLASR